MSDRFTVVPLEEVGGFAPPGQAHWHMVRRTLGIEAFGVNAWRATEAGQRLIAEHDEVSGGGARHEELYVVLEGRATFTVDGETVAAPAGTLVFVRDPATKRAALAEEAGTVVLVVGAKRGEPFTVSAWEGSAVALRFWETEEWDRAIELLSQRHAEHPEHAAVAYNLACAESRAGLAENALEHLARAIDLQPSLASTARDDPDFASIRDDPRFPSAGSP